MALLTKEYVYLLGEFEGSDQTKYVKIGHTTRTVDQRIDQLKTGNARKCKALATIATNIGEAFKLERYYLNRFSKFKCDAGGGEEWFDDTVNMIKPIFVSEAKERNNTESANSASNELADYWKLYEKFSSGKYKDTFKFVQENIISQLQTNSVVVLAPPKSGKRIMVESVAILMPYTHHLFITGLDRKDTEPQYEEFKEYKISVAPLTKSGRKNELNTSKIKEDIESFLNKGENVIIHFDECDFGSHKDGKVGLFLKEIKDMQFARQKLEFGSIHLIVYSATPEEAVFSDADYLLAHYKPNDSYAGPQYFLDNRLVTSPTEFFIYIPDDDRISLTPQALEILDGWIKDDKKMIVIRLNYSCGKKSAFKLAEDKLQDAVDAYLKNAKVYCEFIDENKPFGWFFENSAKIKGHWLNHKDKKTILVINATCTRSTEVGFHPFIYAWHDFRKTTKTTKASTTYSTYAQAIGRVFHWLPDYINNNDRMKHFEYLDTKIKLYAEKGLIEVMAKIYSSSSKDEMLKNWEEYYKNEGARKLNSRTHPVLDRKIHAEIHAFSTQGEAEAKRNEILEKHQDKFSAKGIRKATGCGKLTERKSDKGQNHCKSALIGRMPGGHDIMIHIDGPPGVERWKSYYDECGQYHGKFIVFEPIVTSGCNLQMKTPQSIHNLIK